MNQSHGSIATSEASINNLARYLDDQTTPRPLHEGEQEFMVLVRAVGQAALAQYVARCGVGNTGPVLEDASRKQRRRHGVWSRKHRSLFGPIAVT